MALATKDLSVISYANGFTLWHYASMDDSNTILSENYFFPAASMLRAGDMVLANSDLGDDVQSQILSVAKVDGQLVEVRLCASN